MITLFTRWPSTPVFYISQVLVILLFTTYGIHTGKNIKTLVNLLNTNIVDVIN